MAHVLKNVWKLGWGETTPERTPWRLPFFGEVSVDSVGAAYVELAVVRFVVVMVALVIIVAVTARARRRQARFPNLMVWVGGGGPRRERTELGVAGVYLDRRPLTPEEAAAAAAGAAAVGGTSISQLHLKLRRVRSCSAVPTRSGSLRTVPSPLPRVQSAMSAPLITTPALAAAAALREMVSSPDSGAPVTQPRVRVSRTL